MRSKYIAIAAGTLIFVGCSGEPQTQPPTGTNDAAQNATDGGNPSGQAGTNAGAAADSSQPVSSVGSAARSSTGGETQTTLSELGGFLRRATSSAARDVLGDDETPDGQ
jgi:PBP1b-binding outer membrane lipoprotein LpoB